MALTHGKAAKVYVSGFDVSAYFTKVTAASKADTAEVSTLGTTDKAYLNGMLDGTMSFDGFYDSDPNTAASVMGSAFQGTADTILVHLPQGDVFGAKAAGMVATISDYEIATDTGGAGAITAAAQARGKGVHSGVILHPLSQVAAGANSANVDNTVASNAGIDSFLHVTASSGGPLVVKLQHSLDNITWVDMVIHATVTTPHKSEVKSSLLLVPTGLVNRYIRSLWTLTGTATFFHSATRLTVPH